MRVDIQWSRKRSVSPVKSVDPVEGASAPREKSRKYHSWDIRVFPIELVVKIFANLAACDLLVCTKVNKHWQNIIITEPAIARIFFRSCRPSVPTLPSLTALPRSPATLIPWQNYYRSIRDWLKGFNEQGHQAVLRLDKGLEPVAQRFPEQLFINIANVLGQPRSFDCQEVLTIQHADEVTSICFSPDEQHLAVACWYYPIKIYSFIDQQWQKLPTTPQSANVISASFSANSQALVTLSEHHSAEIWGPVGNRWQKNTHIVDIYPLPSFSAQSQYLVAINRDKIARIYQLVDGQWRPQTTALDNCPTTEACFNPADNHLLATSYGNTVNIWRCINGQWQHDARLPYQFNQYGLYFSPDGCRLLTDSIEFLKPAAKSVCSACIWRVVDGVWQQEAVLSFPDSMDVAHFSSDRNALITILGNPSMELWQLSGETWKEVPLPEHVQESAGYLSADGQHLATYSGPWQISKTARVWRFAGDQWQQEVLIQHAAPMNDVRFSCHGNHVITASDDKTAKIYGYIGGTWRKKATLAHADRVLRVRFSPFGRYILTEEDKTAHLWTLNNQEEGDVSATESDDEPSC